MSEKQAIDTPKKNHPPVKPEKNIPAKPDTDPDHTEQPEKNDPTRIDQPGKKEPSKNIPPVTIPHPKT